MVLSWRRGVSEGAGRLYVCATPIGNLGDVSPRLAETLLQVDLVYAEDTRRTAILLSHLGVEVRTRSLFAGNEKARTEELLAELGAGREVALVSDAGTPTVSDPGAEVVRRALEAGIEVRVIPGPSAVTAALAVSGLGGDRFSFEGFLPRKGRERRRRIESMAAEDRPVVLFASPHRLAADLEDLRQVAGDERQVVIARELTKLYEEVWTGTLAQAAERWVEDVKGEITLVLAPAGAEEPDLEEAVIRAQGLMTEGHSPSDAARQVASELGISRRKIYQALMGRQR